MLNTPITRETTKQAGAVVATLNPTPFTLALAATLNIAVETLGYLGEKRTRELFVTTEFLNKVIEELKKSDDFAGFVYDLWTRHNFESSEVRRRMLKAILENASAASGRDFENFTRILSTSQHVTFKQMHTLGILYSDDAYEASAFPRKTREYYSLSTQQAISLLGVTRQDTEDSAPLLNQLC